MGDVGGRGADGVCPLSLADIQGLRAHGACFPVCRPAYPSPQSPGNYSPAKQKTGEGFRQRASPVCGRHLTKPRMCCQCCVFTVVKMGFGNITYISLILYYIASLHTCKGCILYAYPSYNGVG